MRLGPYSLLAPLGAGGMGEVWRARDTRLGREVALKTLPETRSSDPDRLRRFEQEARAASALNHPNILTVLDVGTHEGVPFIVFELLEGETLRARLAGGALPGRKAVDYAIQAAEGLGAAHDKGIVHRDLKPENLFVTRDGRVKILDFGLARLRPSHDCDGPNAPASTDTSLTSPGALLGTVGYMSPEQVQGAAVDHRSDIFAFGAVLYEMVSGQRAFTRATSAETMTAILRDDPPLISSAWLRVPPGLERLVRRCLEKGPSERFQSARDLVFALEAVAAASGSVGTEPPARAAAGPAWRRTSVYLALLGATLAAAFVLGRRSTPVRFPEYELLTPDSGIMTGGRFAPDGGTILYSVGFGANPSQVFVRRLDTLTTGRLELPPASVLSISSKGEAAILLTTDRDYSFARGTLARIPLSGGTPRPLLEDAMDADWGPDGESLCVWRRVDAEWRLEYPIGNVLVREREHTAFPRVSPKGDSVAFVSQNGDIEVVDRAGRRRSLGVRDLFIFGLAWGPDGDEVWFSGGPGPTSRALWAVDLAGRRRLLARVAGSLSVLDVARDGRALVASGFSRMGIRVGVPGQRAEREIGVAGAILGLARSAPAGLSSDAKGVLIMETARWSTNGPASVAWRSEAHFAASDGSSAVRLGAGRPLALTPDGRWALCLQGPPAVLVELPTGVGEPRVWSFGTLQPDGAWGPARWSADGQTLFVAAQERGHARRVFARRRDSPAWQPVTPEGIDGAFVPSPDGRRLASAGSHDSIGLYDLAGGPPVELANTSGLTPVHWTPDGGALYVRAPGNAPAVLERLDLATGTRHPLMRLMPDDTAGVSRVFQTLFSPSGNAYVYGYARSPTDLYLVRGIDSRRRRLGPW